MPSTRNIRADEERSAVPAFYIVKPSDERTRKDTKVR